MIGCSRAQAARLFGLFRFLAWRYLPHESQGHREINGSGCHSSRRRLTGAGRTAAAAVTAAKALMATSRREVVASTWSVGESERKHIGGGSGHRTKRIVLRGDYVEQQQGTSEQPCCSRSCEGAAGGAPQKGEEFSSVPLRPRQPNPRCLPPPNRIARQRRDAMTRTDRAHLRHRACVLLLPRSQISRTHRRCAKRVHASSSWSLWCCVVLSRVERGFSPGAPRRWRAPRRRGPRGRGRRRRGAGGWPPWERRRQTRG